MRILLYGVHGTHFSFTFSSQAETKESNETETETQKYISTAFAQIRDIPSSTSVGLLAVTTNTTITSLIGNIVSLLKTCKWLSILSID